MEHQHQMTTPTHGFMVRAELWHEALFINHTDVSSPTRGIADPRLASWRLMGSPLPTLVILVVWMIFVFGVGPRMMRHRPAYSLRGFVQFINVLQVFTNLYVTYEFMSAGWFNDYNWLCQPYEVTYTRDALRMVHASYNFYLLKLFDLVDTVLYVLRKKNNQITFLHVFHHISTVTIGWTVANFGPVGQATFTELLNCIVHIIMYTYYFLAALGPQYQKYLWWKKYLTTFQLVQFVAQFAHNGYAVVTDCAYPHFIIYIFEPTIFIIFLLFINFYIKNYRSKGNQDKKKE